MDLRQQVLGLVRTRGLITAGDRVLVAVSGGIDSSVLLHVLAELREQIGCDLAVGHVNHQLRGPESDRDEVFVRHMAEDLALAFHGTRISVKEYAGSKGLSIQHAARDLRYISLEDMARSGGYNRIAVAHNLDDQVETFLLRVIKGTGIRGLGSIPVARGKIVRPLLFTPRSAITLYSRKNRIGFVEDSSNRKENYERNFIRRRIVPVMAKLNPAFREKVLLLLTDVTAINSRYDDEAKAFLEAYAKAGIEEVRLPVGPLMALDEEVRFRVLLRLIFDIEPTFIPLRRHVGLIEKALSSTRPNASTILPKGIRVDRVYDVAVLTKKSPSPTIEESFVLRRGSNILPPFNLRIDVAVIGKRPVSLHPDDATAFFDGEALSSLSVRTFRKGDRFIPLGMEHPVKLKDFFISRKVPRHERRLVPLLLSGDDIMWVIGHRIDERYKVRDNSRRIIKVTCTAGGCKPSLVLH